MKTLSEEFLFILGISRDLVPSKQEFRKIKKYIDNIPQAKLSSILLKYGFFNSEKSKKSENFEKNKEKKRRKLIKKVFPKKERNRILEILPESIDNQRLDGKEKVLRRIEWKLLKIGQVSNRNEILNNISLKNKKYDLIDVITLADDTLLESIKEVLLYKLKLSLAKEKYKKYKKLIDLDSQYCLIIMASSLDKKSGEYNLKKLIDRFENRILSDIKLTSYFQR